MDVPAELLSRTEAVDFYTEGSNGVLAKTATSWCYDKVGVPFVATCTTPDKVNAVNHDLHAQVFCWQRSTTRMKIPMRLPYSSQRTLRDQRHAREWLCSSAQSSSSLTSSRFVEEGFIVALNVRENRAVAKCVKRAFVYEHKRCAMYSCKAQRLVPSCIPCV